METLKHPACTVGWVIWVARLCRSCLSPGKATRISHGRNPNGTIQLLKIKKNIKKALFLAVLWLNFKGLWSVSVGNVKIGTVRIMRKSSWRCRNADEYKYLQSMCHCFEKSHQSSSVTKYRGCTAGRSSVDGGLCQNPIFAAAKFCGAAKGTSGWIVLFLLNKVHI